MPNYGPKNGFWKGGRTVASNGYILIRVGTDHHLADSRGYAYEHRLVAETTIGRRLQPGELVHHRNGDKQDNRPENLEVVAGNAGHQLHHRTARLDLRLPGEGNTIEACACGCGGTFLRYDSQGRPRRFLPNHNGKRRISRATNDD